MTIFYIILYYNGYLRLLINTKFKNNKFDLCKEIDRILYICIYNVIAIHTYSRTRTCHGYCCMSWRICCY